MRTLLLCLSLLSFIACKKDTPSAIKDENVPIITPNGGVYVTNEGNFGSKNSSISYYNYSDRSVTLDVFKAANNKDLGDICQSMEIYNGKAYIVVNNSHKIEIVDPVTFKNIGTIDNLNSPRYFLGVSSTKAYVSDLKSNHISVIDLDANVKIKEIYCPGWTEEMILHDDMVYVTNVRKEHIYVVDTKNDLIVDSIKVGPAPNAIKKDKNNKLWVLSGDSYTKKKYSLSRVDPKTKKEDLHISFPDHHTPQDLKINGTLDTLYYLNNGIYSFPITNATPSLTPFIPQGNILFYGLGIDAHSGDIFVSDAIDYNQNGKVYIYSSNGSFIDSFNVGLIPGEFTFY